MMTRQEFLQQKEALEAQLLKLKNERKVAVADLNIRYEDRLQDLGDAYRRDRGALLDERDRLIGENAEDHKRRRNKIHAQEARLAQERRRREFSATESPATLEEYLREARELGEQMRQSRVQERKAAVQLRLSYDSRFSALLEDFRRKRGGTMAERDAKRDELEEKFRARRSELLAQDCALVAAWRRQLEEEGGEA